MATERQQIIRHIHQLCSGDEEKSRQAQRWLVERGPPVLGLVSAGLACAEPEARAALIRVLAGVGGTAGLVRLMRFVFDTREDPATGTARALAMQAIIEVAGPEDEGKIFAFLRDIRHDTDPLVRTYVVECLATLRNARVLNLLRDALSDPSQYVRDRARRAFGEVQKRQKIHPLELEGRDFLHELTRADNERQQAFERLLPEHPQAFELASTLVRRDGEHTQLGIQTLHQLQNPAARNVALRHFKLTRSDADRAASLRLMAAFLHADARAEEVRTIEQGMGHADGFVQLAALEAAGRSGHEPLIRRALSATRADNAIIAATAATGLYAVAKHLPSWMSPKIIESIQTIRWRRAHEPNSNLLQGEAALLGTLAVLVSPRDKKVRNAQQIVFESLRNSHQFIDIARACLHALERLTPKCGYSSAARWHPGDACVLVPLLNHPDAQIQRRALEVIRRGAPGDTPNLCHEFERLLYANTHGSSPLLVSAIIETNAAGAAETLARWLDSQDIEIQRDAGEELQTIHTSLISGESDFGLEADPTTNEFKRQ